MGQVTSNKGQVSGQATSFSTCHWQNHSRGLKQFKHLRRCQPNDELTRQSDFMMLATQSAAI